MTRKLLLLFVLFGFALGTVCSAQDSTATLAKKNDAKAESAEKAVEKARHKRMRAFAQQFEVYVDSTSNKKARLLEQPIFRWSNPERDAIGGAVFLWTHEGRPHATIGIWTYDDTARTDSYEVQSISERPFRTENPVRPWSPRSAGIEFHELKNVSTPSKSTKLRLPQMRNLAKKHFSARLLEGGASSKLRLLPTPAYRYDSYPADVVEGAMFSLAQGTDPEVFLILEARKQKGKLSWHYAFVSQTSQPAFGLLNDKELWNNRSQGDAFQMTMRRPAF